MDQVEDHVLGQVHTRGRQWDQQNQQFINIPEDLAERPPKIVQDGKFAAKQLLNLDIDGIQFGHGVRHTDPLPNVEYGRLMQWTTQLRDQYTIADIRPGSRTSLASRGSHADRCFLLAYQIAAPDYFREDEIHPDLSPLWSPSTRPWTPAPFDDD
eukprot:5767388-Pyramimonas_sp.AAC.1